MLPYGHNPFALPGNTYPQAQTPPGYDKFFSFYTGVGTDASGRSLNTIWSMPADQKATDLNYIQWLFPTDKPSAFSKDAPVMELELFFLVRENPKIMDNIKLSFQNILSFMGLQYDEKTQVVQTGPKAFENDKYWLVPHSPFYRSISRILYSLQLFGLEAEAKALFNFLHVLKGHPNLDVESVHHWENLMKN